MHVGLFARVAHQVPELPREKLLASFHVAVTAVVVGKVFSDWCCTSLNLLAEEIDLVEEEDESRLLEVLAVGDALEEHEGFVHLVLGVVCQLSSIPIIVYIWRGGAYAIAVFDKDVVIAADGDEEEHHLHVVEDVYPLLTLRSLAADIEHAVGEIAGVEEGLADAGGS